MRPFERLDAWRLGHELTLGIYSATRHFPDDERFGITAQLRRASSSVPANVAEGSSAGSKKEFLRHLRIALRSLNEVSHWLLLARDLTYLGTDDWEALDRHRDRTGLVIWRLIQSLGR